MWTVDEFAAIVVRFRAIHIGSLITAQFLRKLSEVMCGSSVTALSVVVNS